MQNQISSFHDIEAQSIFLSPHVSAKLIAEQLADGVWNLYLQQITGAKVEFVFGKNFSADEKLALSEILPTKIHLSHQMKVNTILTDGSKSPYWNSLFSNMLGRTIKIRNPITDEPRFVKIIMKQVQLILPQYEFDITLLDETSEHLFHLQQIDKAHDIRALMRGGINLLTQSSIRMLTELEFLQLAKEKPELLYQEMQKEQQQLIEVMDQTLCLASFCDSSKTDKQPDFSNIQQSLSALQAKIEIVWHGQPALFDDLLFIENLTLTLKHLVELAIINHFPKIFINHRLESMIYVCDLLMPLPINQLQDLTTQILDKFHSIGGEFKMFDNQHFLFAKKMAAAESISLDCSEIEQQVKQNPNINIILLVDDVVISLKFLFHICLQSLIKFKLIEKPVSSVPIMHSIHQANWQDRQFFTHPLEQNFLFVCCANANVAMEIIKKFKITGMITDMEMPGDKNGHDLIVWVKAFEAINKLPPMQLLINTALCPSDFEEQHPRLSHMQIPYICKGEKKLIETFIQHSLDEQKSSLKP